MPDRVTRIFWNTATTLTWNSPSACGVVAGYTLGCGPNGAAFGYPYSAFPGSDIQAIFDAGLAHYNSLQIKAETKSARYGIYALVGYTYSRSYDTGFSDGLGSIIGATYFPLPNWQNLDWGLSQINLNNNFTASIIYQLPVRQRPEMGRQLERRHQRSGRRLGVNRNRTCHLWVSCFRSRQQQLIRREFREREFPNSHPPEYDLQPRAQPSHAFRLVQRKLLLGSRRPASSATRPARHFRVRISSIPTFRSSSTSRCRAKECGSISGLSSLTCSTIRSSAHPAAAVTGRISPLFRRST